MLRRHLQIRRKTGALLIFLSQGALPECEPHRGERSLLSGLLSVFPFHGSFEAKGFAARLNDVGFGDAVIPDWLDYPTLLSMPAPRILAYPMNAVVAEKLDALFTLGMLNSRMKDFFDIWFLAGTFPFTAKALAGAIQATFERRNTVVTSDGLSGLLQELAHDEGKRTQWRAFLRKSGLEAPDDFARICEAIAAFVLSPTHAVTGDQPPYSWRPGGPWI